MLSEEQLSNFIAEARAAVSALIAALREAQAPAWVAVAAQLPADNSHVLAVFAHGAYSNTTKEPVFALFLLVDQFDRPNQFVVRGGFNPAEKFSHWMPLPTPPTT